MGVFKRRKKNSAYTPGVQYSASDIARIHEGETPRVARTSVVPLADRLTLKETNAMRRHDAKVQRRKVLLCLGLLAVVSYLALGVMGASGERYLGSSRYCIYNPVEVAYALYIHAYNALADITHAFDAYTNAWIDENVPGYWAIPQRAQVLLITILCACLLSVSGMLYQNVFKNPLAGPGLLGASHGIGLGMMLLVLFYGGAATSMVNERYMYCYGFGIAILGLVLLLGKRLSGRGRPMDIVSMLLIGSILGQLLGFIVSYFTLFVMDESDYATYFLLSQMLVVDTSLISWISLAVAATCTFVPVFLLRYHMNSLAFSESEVRVWGLSYGKLRAIALVCGAVMILAAQVHTGMVGMVSLIVPFVARAWFSCEFSKQLVGCLCLSSVFLVTCRLICDLVPFVGDGLAIGSIVGVAAIPLLLLLVTNHVRGWE